MKKLVFYLSYWIDGVGYTDFMQLPTPAAVRDELDSTLGESEVNDRVYEWAKSAKNEEDVWSEYDVLIVARRIG